MPNKTKTIKARKAVKKVVKKIEKKAEAAATQGAVEKLAGKGRYRGLKGRGGYWSDLGNKFLDFGGRALNAGVDKAMEKGIEMIMGSGRYRPKKNSIVASSLSGRGFYTQHLIDAGVPLTPSMASGFPTNSAPSFASGKGADTILTHREYVQDITSSTNFTTTTFPLNPGNPSLFPWLSQLANLYEEYEFLGLVLEYKSLSASAVGTTSSALGDVIMATDYDCEDTNYNNKRQMQAEEFSGDAKPYETFIHPVECDPSKNVAARLYVEPGITASTQAPGDPRFSVLGNFTIATQGQQTAGQTIGELWVSYHVRLSKPILTTTAPNSAAYSAHFSCQLSTSGVPSAATVVTNDPTRFTFTASGTSTTTAGLTMLLNNSATAGPYLVTTRSVQSGTTAWATPSTPTPAVIGGASVLANMMYSNAGPGVADTAVAFAAAADTATTWDGNNVCAVSIMIGKWVSGSTIGIPLYCQSNNISSVDVFVASWNPTTITAGRRRRRLGGTYDARIDRLEQMLSKTKVEAISKDEMLIQPSYDSLISSSSSSSSSSSIDPKTQALQLQEQCDAYDVVYDDDGVCDADSSQSAALATVLKQQQALIKQLTVQNKSQHNSSSIAVGSTTASVSARNDSTQTKQ